MTDKILDLLHRRDTVVIFRVLAEDDVFRNLMLLLEADNENMSDYLNKYANVVYSLYITGKSNLSEHLLKIVLESENMYSVQVSKGEKLDIQIQETLFYELKFIQEISQLTPEDFFEDVEYEGFVPKWTTSHIDFIGSYNERLSLINHYGYGIWCANNMFIIRENEIVPVKSPDNQKLSELYGYKRERQAVIDNTLALLDGKPAQNVLLYGDAGTGKSSTVKAVVNEYASRGLRLIEVSKEQLRDIPEIIDEISDNPLKFILFIDDLSFSSEEDSFGALKAMLEGTVSARSANTVIYATSNRRHLIKERFSDRDGDDIHRNDSMQEKLSLSARFGLRVNFERPDKSNYLAIVKQLAEQNHLNLDESILELKAEQFAMSSGNGRSPRTAKQLINQLLNERN